MKEYKRLTERDENGVAIYKQKCNADSYEENLYIHVQREEAVLNRLAELEDKIENGTLIELPCKVGTTVYYIVGVTTKKILKQKSDYYITKTQFFIDMLENYQNNWFLTKAEAETKLKELKGEV